MWPFGLLQRDSEVRRLWKDAFDAYFPTAVDRANAAFVEVDIERSGGVWRQRSSRRSWPGLRRRDERGLRDRRRGF